MTWPTKNDFVDGDVLTAAQVNNIADNLNIFNPTSATNGQILTANGSGGVSYVTPATAGGWTVIQSGNISNVASLSLTSIPTTYKNLHLYIRDTGLNGQDNIRFRFNGDSTSNYTGWVRGQNGGNGYASIATSFNASSYADITGLQTRSGVDRAAIVISCWDYTNTTSYKQWSGRMTYQTLSNLLGVAWFDFSHFNITAAVTSLEIYSAGTTFITGGTYILYGEN